MGERVAHIGVVLRLGSASDLEISERRVRGAQPGLASNGSDCESHDAGGGRVGRGKRCAVNGHAVKPPWLAILSLWSAKPALAILRLSRVSRGGERDRAREELTVCRSSVSWILYSVFGTERRTKACVAPSRSWVSPMKLKERFRFQSGCKEDRYEEGDSFVARKDARGDPGCSHQAPVVAASRTRI